MKILNGSFPSIEQMNGRLSGTSAAGAVKTPEKEETRRSFADILKEKRTESGEELKFSKHASLRLSDRNIELSDSQLSRLTSGTKRAGEKGINESLVIMDELAFIVNVKNNTVITAMDQKEADENIFTNIDGAVIV